MTVEPTPEATEEPRFVREMRAKRGDEFVDAALAVVKAAPPLSEAQIARMRQIFAAARSGRRAGAA